MSPYRLLLLPGVTALALEMAFTLNLVQQTNMVRRGRSGNPCGSRHFDIAMAESGRGSRQACGRVGATVSSLVSPRWLSRAKFAM
jgi:hypothetical protein